MAPKNYAIVTAAVNPALKERLEQAMEKLTKELKISRSELIEAILSAFFSTNQPPNDANYGEMLVRKLRKGELNLCLFNTASSKKYQHDECGGIAEAEEEKKREEKR